MLISENEIELESLLERHLYENSFNKVNVNIKVYNIDEVEIRVTADDKRLSISMCDDDFDNEDHFYSYMVMVMDKYLKLNFYWR